jgi:anthranilate phosphoribosyltransferase
MDIKEALNLVIQKQDLSASQMQDVMGQILTGHVTSAQIAGFLVALRMKGETITEITAAVETLYHYAEKCFTNQQPLVDIVGTGGDGAKTFNISTTVAFVVAAAGGHVAKHGNRSFSSSSGSADVLELAGLNLNLTSEQVMQCVAKIGIGFLFAPTFHGAMRFAALPRKELGIRTLFNLLGPLTNPAQTRHQLIGVYDKKWLEPVAQVLKNLGSIHALVVNSHDGLDEISIADNTDIAELRQGVIKTYTLNPEDYGFKKQSIAPLTVQNSQQSYDLMLKALNNEPGPVLDIVLLNAAATLYAADIAPSISAGVELARRAIADGLAKQKLEALIALSRRLG